MFSFFKKKPAAPPPAEALPVVPLAPAGVEIVPWDQVFGPASADAEAPAEIVAPADRLVEPRLEPSPAAAMPAAELAPAPPPTVAAAHPVDAPPADPSLATAPPPQHTAEPESAAVSPSLVDSSVVATQSVEPPPLPAFTAWSDVFDTPTPEDAPAAESEAFAVTDTTAKPQAEGAERAGWLGRLTKGLRRTGTSLTQVFTGGAKIDDDLYEQLEEALLLADAGPKATEHLLADLRRRVKAARATDPQQVRALLQDAIADLLAPLQRGLEVGRFEPTVMMVVGVNGAGKTTTIGKITRHLAEHEQRVLLAAGDTFRAAAREQLAVWALRNDHRRTAGATTYAGAPLGQVEIISQQGADPAAVSFDAVQAGKARGADVVIVDTAGRLPTQLHLMEELRKIRRVIAKAEPTAPHEVLLVVDGNTGQNALAQVKAFDDALGLTGLIVTKLDGTAKGGVLAAIALWGRDRKGGPVPVYFIGVGETLEDLQTFDAREFAQALLG